MTRTVVLPDGRIATQIPADDAGEYVLSAAEGLLMHLEATGKLSWRQVTAGAELARLYGLGGGRRPWCRGGGTERPEPIQEAARAEFDSLLQHAPHRTRWPLTILAMGEWMVSTDPVPLWREGLTAIADHLRLAPEENP